MVREDLQRRLEEFEGEGAGLQKMVASAAVLEQLGDSPCWGNTSLPRCHSQPHGAHLCWSVHLLLMFCATLHKALSIHPRLLKT